MILELVGGGIENEFPTISAEWWLRNKLNLVHTNKEM
jgi:hypothetical protein